jgi:hypothetical protein
MLKGRKNRHLSGLFLPTLAVKQSFAELRDAFTRALVLAQFDPARLIRLMTGASGFAIASIISQQQDNLCSADSATRTGESSQGRARKGH